MRRAACVGPRLQPIVKIVGKTCARTDPAVARADRKPESLFSRHVLLPKYKYSPARTSAWYRSCAPIIATSGASPIAKSLNFDQREQARLSPRQSTSTTMAHWRFPSAADRLGPIRCQVPRNSLRWSASSTSFKSGICPQCSFLIAMTALACCPAVGPRSLY